ncbi:hypothetical protein KQI84_01330 [bacterium]|nr:hypothetical protein [bacterium]
MLAISASDKAYFRRLWQYWRDRHDNPMVMYGVISGRSLGHRALNIKLLTITSVLGFSIPLVFLLYRINMSVSRLLEHFTLLSLLLSPVVSILPAISLHTFAPGRRCEHLLSELRTTNTSSGELAFGAVWLGLRSHLIVMLPLFLGYAAAAMIVLSSAHDSMLARYYFEDRWMNTERLVMLVLATTAMWIWALLIAIRCWLVWKDRLVESILIPPIVAFCRMFVGLAVLFATFSGPAVFLQEFMDFPSESAELVGGFITIVVLVILLAATIRDGLREVGRHSGAKFLYAVDQVELQDRSWLENEAASRLEKAERRAALKEQGKRLHLSPTMITASLGLSMVLIGLLAILMHKAALPPEVPSANGRSWSFGDYELLAIFAFAVQAVLPSLFFAITMAAVHIKGRSIPLVSGALIGGTSNLAMRFLLWAQIPSLLCAGITIFAVVPTYQWRVFLFLFEGILSLLFQILFLLLTSLCWLRWRSSLIFLPFLLSFSASFLLVIEFFTVGAGGYSDREILMLVSAPTLIGLLALYFSVFRLWDWLQEVHDRHLRGVPRHTIAEIE